MDNLKDLKVWSITEFDYVITKTLQALDMLMSCAVPHWKLIGGQALQVKMISRDKNSTQSKNKDVFVFPENWPEESYVYLHIMMKTNPHWFANEGAVFARQIRLTFKCNDTLGLACAIEPVSGNDEIVAAVKEAARKLYK